MRRLAVPSEGSVSVTVTVSSTTGSSPFTVTLVRCVPALNAPQPLAPETSGPSAAHGPSGSVPPSDAAGSCSASVQAYAPVTHE